MSSRLHMLHPDDMNISKRYTNAEVRTREFEPDDPVWVRNCTGKSKWIAGKVIIKTGPVSYKVKVGEQIQRRHLDQLKKRLVEIRVTSHPTDSFLLLPSPQSSDEQLTRERRYPLRENRRPPERYQT